MESNLKRMLSRRIAVVCAALAASVAVMALASPAMATFKGEFKVFENCPIANPSTFACLYSLTESGEVKVGTTAVPIVNTITLQGGISETSNDLIPAAKGDTLSKTGQPVPGGLLGIIAPKGWPKFLQEIFNKFINEGITGVSAITELVGPAEVNFINFLTTEGTAVALPVRVKLVNAFLGNECFVGSAKNPVKLVTTTGTTSPPKPNKPITGSPGTLSENAAGTILFDTGFTIVDNSFSAPGAEGCGGIFSFLVDEAVNAKLGIPSAAGNNAAVLSGKQELATKENIEANP